jgi:ribosomal-protein-alanine N-acetyltransferase
MRARAEDLIVEPMGPGDLVAFAQCLALDVTVFPYASIPALAPGAEAPAIWICRAGRGGEVAGFLAATREGPILEIHGLAVAPGRRRLGAGRALLGAARAGAEALGCLAVALQVSTANAAAIALYVGEGFVKVRRHSGYYRRGVNGDGGDAFAMMLPVGPG